ncbi:CDP-alcohol phosphatidyltransferase family protein [Candidatus Woesearchaeota archaeon]|nr:CDP-alcohol phosphatidyltransferase family protein [Candidatus Woesearchaeota archaeon]
MRTKNIFTLPNMLSLSRIPFAILIILQSDSLMRYVWLGLAALSDFFDGLVARKMKLVTKTGAMIDGFADKVFVIAIFGYFFVELNLPLYFIILFFLRDIVTSIAAVFLLTKKVVIPARMLGKITTILQFLVLLFMVAKQELIVLIGVYSVFAFSMASLVDYFFYAKNKDII